MSTLNNSQIRTLQRVVGTTPDGIFGRNTLRAARDYFNMSSESAAHFFGQCHHETANFRFFVENLNYSEAALLRVFRRHFTDEETKQFARQPERIANRVYSNRMGNGNEASGDGWLYRGRGAIQLTGRNNYTSFSRYMKDDTIVTNPDIVANEYAFQSALFFFDTNNLWALTQKVDDASIRALTRRINGGFNGLADRIKQTKNFYRMLS